MGVHVMTAQEEVVVGPTRRILGSKVLAARLKRRDRPDQAISDARVRQYADATDRWLIFVGERTGLSADEIRERLLERHPSMVEVDGDGNVLGLAGVAAEVMLDSDLRRKSKPGVRGGPLEYAVDFPLIGFRLTDYMRRLGVEAEGVNAEREWVFPEEYVELFEGVDRRRPGNPTWVARPSEPESEPEEGAAE